MVDMQDQFGRKLASWIVSAQTISPKRSFAWYLVFGIVLFIFFLYSIFSQNFLFAIIIVIFAFIMIFDRYNPKKDIEVGIYETGVSVDNTFYDFRDFDRFRLYYEPPVKNLYFVRERGIVSPFMKIPLENQNPLEVREILLVYLPEDLERDGEYWSDKVQRWFRF